MCEKVRFHLATWYHHGVYVPDSPVDTFSFYGGDSIASLSHGICKICLSGNYGRIIGLAIGSRRLEEAEGAVIQGHNLGFLGDDHCACI